MTTIPPPSNKSTFVEKKGDKRRQNRIQSGGWGSGSRGRGASRGQGAHPRGGRGSGPRHSSPHQSAYGAWQNVDSSQSQQAHSDFHSAPTYQVECNEHQPQQQQNEATMTWRGQPGYAGYQAFTFETPDEVDKKELRKEEVKEVQIRNEGQTILSTNEASIPSEIIFTSKFLSPEEAANIYDTLVREINWNRRVITKPDGSTYEEPRKTFWFGELPYSYSRVTMESCKTWHPVVENLRKMIEKNTSHTFNSVLCNYYEDGKDGVQWHSDDEYSLGNLPVIASLSLGETRKFQLRKKPYPGAKNEEDYVDVEKYFIHLESGSLLVMRGATQEDWQHRVPKEYHERKGRINLTFRTIHPDPRHM